MSLSCLEISRTVGTISKFMTTQFGKISEESQKSSQFMKGESEMRVKRKKKGIESAKVK